MNNTIIYRNIYSKKYHVTRETGTLGGGVKFAILGEYLCVFQQSKFENQKITQEAIIYNYLEIKTLRIGREEREKQGG